MSDLLGWSVAGLSKSVPFSGSSGGGSSPSPISEFDGGGEVEEGLIPQAYFVRHLKTCVPFHE